MGLRAKIIGLFFVGFSVLSAAGIYVLESNLKQSYSAIERQEAVETLHQLIFSLDDKFSVLNQLTSDWAFWDQMYNFVEKPNDAFSQNEIGPTALQVIGMDFAIILNNQDQIVFFEETGKEQRQFLYSAIVDHVKWRSTAPRTIEKQNCGLDSVRDDVYLMCWQQILHADMSGPKVGMLILGRKLDDAMRSAILRRISPNFTFTLIAHDNEINPYHLATTFDPASLEFSDAEQNTLSAKLMNVVGQPIYAVQYHYPKDISQRGDEVATKVVMVLLAVTFLNGLVLMSGIHAMLIRRLDTMAHQVNEISETGRWGENLEVSKKRDELNTLGSAINKMLSFIRQQMSSLETIASTDSLTKISNRFAFDQRLSVDLSVAKRNQTGRCSLLIIDVDFFKQYNDQYGHPTGDAVLKTLAQLLKTTATRPSDMSARIGGEEFAVILPTSHVDGAVFVANKILNKLAQLKIPHSKSSISEYVTISIGVTIAINTDDESSLMKRADMALYQAKSQGRNRVCVVQANTETHV